MLQIKFIFVFLLVILVTEAKTKRQNRYNTIRNSNKPLYKNALSLSIEKNSNLEYPTKNFYKKEPVSRTKKKFSRDRKNKTLKPENNTVLGCRKSGLCCQGKNNNCITKGPRMNGRNNITCYCDASCLPLKDCCIDYTDHCKEVNCLLGQWMEWSECDAACGFGERHRERRVIQKPRNGAPACEPTIQKQVCEGVSCKRVRNSRSYGGEIRETAQILALKYGDWREAYKYDPLKDIRRNIYQHLGHNTTQRSSLNYCGLYKLEYVLPTCKKSKKPSKDSKEMKTGSEICVECQHTAINKSLGSRCYGHGVEGKVTKWTQMGKKQCKGTWVLEKLRQQCSCKKRYPDLQAFIFI